MKDSNRVVLKQNRKVYVDGADTGWKWIKTNGFHKEFKLIEENGVSKISHYKRSVFVLKILDYHNGCGELG